METSNGANNDLSSDADEHNMTEAKPQGNNELIDDGHDANEENEEESIEQKYEKKANSIANTLKSLV
jgi:hypothetical protein